MSELNAACAKYTCKLVTKSLPSIMSHCHLHTLVCNEERNRFVNDCNNIYSPDEWNVFGEISICRKNRENGGSGWIVVDVLI